MSLAVQFVWQNDLANNDEGCHIIPQRIDASLEIQAWCAAMTQRLHNHHHARRKQPFFKGKPNCTQLSMTPTCLLCIKLERLLTLFFFALLIQKQLLLNVGLRTEESQFGKSTEEQKISKGSEVFFFFYMQHMLCSKNSL